MANSIINNGDYSSKPRKKYQNLCAMNKINENQNFIQNKQVL